MIQIYKPGNEAFSKNGNAVLQCFRCEVTAELNGTWVLNAEVPLDSEGRWKLVTEEAVLKVPTWQDDEQLYRISQVTKTEDGVSVIAYPIFYDSANDCFLMDCRPTGKQAQQALDIMMDGSPYSGETNITAASTAYFVRRNLLDAICGSTSPTFLERWGGEIIYDNYKIIIDDHIGGDYGVEARYGRNIEGVSYVVDGTNIVTRIVPVAYNGYMMSGDEPWVDSEYIDSYAKVYTREIHYENIRMEADAGSGDDDSLIICNTQAELDAALQAAAEADFANGMDAATITIDVDMAVVQSMASLYTEDLQDTDGNTIQDNTGQDILSSWYRDYANLEQVRLGDTIRCRHARLDITSTARVISITWDCCLKKVSHVTLGDYSYNYVKNISTAINRVAGITHDDGTLIAEKVKGFLDGAQTQLRTQYNLATKQDVMAIVFENLDEDSPMYGALGIGTQGICISKNRTADGRDWDWTTGITANGINTSMGVFGILSDKLGKNWFNLDTGEFKLSSETLIGGKTIEGYMSEADQALADYATATDKTLASLQSQIDGQYSTYFYDYTPTLANLPASEWTTETLKAQHEGDLFYNKTDGNSYRFFKNNGVWEWTLITDTVATQALALASTAKDTADGKRRVFTAQPVPPYDVGDIYFDGNKILVCMTAKASGTAYQATDFVKRDAYTDNQTFGDFVDSYNDTISGIQSGLDDRIETWSQATDPSVSWTAAEQASHAGDLWIDTGSGVTRYWTGSAWTEFTSNPPATVISSINSKATIFTSQPTPPYRVGDLWFDSLSADIMTCMTQRLTGNFNANDWAKRNKYTDDTELTNFIDGDFAEVTESLQSQVDAKIESWYQNTDPALAWTGHTTEALQDHTGADITDENSEIITAEYESEKILHEGDIWYNTADGTQWRYHLGVWEEIDVPAVLWDTVDSKKTIYSTQPVPPYNVNDLWVQGETGDILVCKTGRSSGSFSADDWILASKYTDDSALTTFINGSYADTIDELREQADGKAETWYQAADPSTTWDDPAIHKGDLWYNTNDQTTWFWDGSTWKQQDIPTEVFDKIDSKAQIFAIQPTVPYYKNDLWYTGTVVKVCITTRETGTFNEKDWEKKDNYTDDSALTNFINNEFETLRSETGKKVETWYQNTDPAAAWTTEALKTEHAGDIWYNTTSNIQKTYRYTGTRWEELTANPPKAVFDSIDGKATIYIGSTTPSAPSEGDLWMKSAAEDILTYVDGSWIKYNKYTDDSTLTNFINGEYKETIASLQSQEDGKAETWIQTADPASAWKTEGEKTKHTGDIWYNSAPSVQKYYMFDGTAWVEMKTEPPAAIMDEIDGKAQIFAAQPTVPYYKNDVWFTGTDIKICTSTRTTGSYTESDWVKKDNYTDDSALTDWISEEYASDLANTQALIDGKIDTWYQDSDPSSSWSAEDKPKHSGDIWQNSSIQKAYRYTGSEWQELTTTPPDAVFDRIDSKAQIFSSQPTIPYYRNDLWYTGSVVKVCVKERTTGSFTASDWEKKDYYTDDSALTTFIDGEFKNLKEANLSKIETYYQDTDPSVAWTTQKTDTLSDQTEDPILDNDGQEITTPYDVEKTEHIGDLWYRTTDNTQWRYTGDAWEQMNVPDDVFDKIDSKAHVYVGSATPADPQERDLWFKGVDEGIYTYIGEKWVEYNKYTDDSGLKAFIEGDYADALKSISEQLDGKSEIWYQETDPSASWTDETKSEHYGDFWVIPSSNVQKIYSASGWSEVTYEIPTDLVDKWDGKAQVFVAQPTPPYYKNDLWYTGNDVKVCIADRSSGSFVASEWIKKDNYTDDSALEDWLSDVYASDLAKTQTKIDGKIETWYQNTDPADDWASSEKEEHTGDIWQNTGTQKTYRYTGSAWQEMTSTPPDEVFDKIDTKAQIFAVQPTIPYYKNDLWYTGTVVKVCTTTRTTGSFTASDWAKKDYYTDDSALQAFIEGDFADTLAEVQNQIDGKIQTWYQEKDPSLAWKGKEESVLQDHTGADILDESDEQISGPVESEKLLHIGDIWQNSTDNTQWRWGYGGGGWEPMSVPNELMDTLDGKSAVFVGTSTPKNPEDRDLWFKGADQPILTYVNGTWVEYNKYTSDENLYDFVDNTYTPTIDDIQIQLDGKIELWFYDYVPTLANIPAVDWTTNDEKSRHVGDLFYNTKKNEEASYRFEYDSGSNTFVWNRITDARTEQALIDASNAQDTADGKRRIFTVQPTPPYDVGDMWVQGASGDILVCKKAKESGSYAASDFEKASKYTDDSEFKNWILFTYSSDLDAVNKQLDKKIQTWYQNTNPATDWSTDKVKSEHVGDVWQRKDTGRTYIYTSTTSGETATYSWEEITTTPPVAVQNVIESKRQVFVGTDTPKPPYVVGDLWITDSTGTGVMRYCSTARSEGNGQISDWSLTPTETKAQATLQSLNGKIIAKVVAGDIINAINISKEGIKIDATNLNINGVVSANNNFKINTDGSFETIKGTIGQINITSTDIHSGSHNTVKSESAGFILNKDGEFSVGDKDQYVRYYKGTDGKYAAEIKVNALTIAGETAATAADIRSVTKIANDAVDAAKAAADTSGGTATNFLYWDSTNGLIVSETGSKDGTSDKPYNVQVLGTGINFRNGTKTLGSINGTSFTLYKPGSNSIKAMELLSDGLYFYKNDGTTVSSKFTNNGLEIASGTIGGFTIDSKALYIGTLGKSDSAFVSSGTTAKADIAGSGEKTGWLFTASNTFGVNKDGNVYFNKGLIGNIVIDTNSIHTSGKTTLTNKTDGFYLASDGSFSIGNDTSYLKWESTKDEGETSKTWKLKAYVTELLIGGTNVKSKMTSIESTANSANSNANSAVSTANAANGNASAALSKAQYLYQSADTGVVVTTNPTNPTSGYHTQITSNGINLRYGINTKLGITSDSVAMYAGSGASAYKAMELTSSGLVFNRYASSGVDEVASITKSDGLYVKKGKIGGFTVSNSADTNTHAFSDSLYGQVQDTDRIFDYEYGICNTVTAAAGTVFYVVQKLVSNTWESKNFSYLFRVQKNGNVTLGGDFSCSGNMKCTGSLKCSDFTVSSGKITGDFTANKITISSIGDYGSISLKGVSGKTYSIDGNGYATFSIVGCDQMLTNDIAIRKGTDITNPYFLANKSNIILGSTTYLSKPKNGTGWTVYLDQTNAMCTSASSIRYKTIDRKFTEDDVKKAYDINVYWATYKPGFLSETDPWNGKSMPMFIAENVAENIPEAALYADGQTEDWCERVMIPIHHQMIKDQKKHIEALEAEVKQLKEALRHIA